MELGCQRVFPGVLGIGLSAAQSLYLSTSCRILSGHALSLGQTLKDSRLHEIRSVKVSFRIACWRFRTWGVATWAASVCCREAACLVETLEEICSFLDEFQLTTYLAAGTDEADDLTCKSAIQQNELT
eukprot:6482691-Amphidinium_carterae.1